MEDQSENGRLGREVSRYVECVADWLDEWKVRVRMADK